MNTRNGAIVTRFIPPAESSVQTKVAVTTLGKDWFVTRSGFGPKPESVHFMERNVSRTKFPRNIKPATRVDLDHITLTRWKLVSQVLQKHSVIWNRYRRPYDVGIYNGWELPIRHLNANYIDPKIPNWPGKELLGQAKTILPEILISLATAVYGGLHATAWQAYFPTVACGDIHPFLSPLLELYGVFWCPTGILRQAIRQIDGSELSSGSATC